MHGVSVVARALGLEYYALKRRGDAMVPSGRPSRAMQAFVEVTMPAAPLPEVAEYLVEMERPDGARMRVRLTNQEGVVALSESFWGCRP